VMKMCAKREVLQWQKETFMLCLIYNIPNFNLITTVCATLL